MLITMTGYSQIGEKLEGIWIGEKSSYYVMIVSNAENKLKFIDVSWEQGNILKGINTPLQFYLVPSL